MHAGKASPSLQFTGDVDVENLHTVDDLLQDDFINWERLDVRGLNYQQGPDRVEIAEVVARKPYARVIIETDTSLNVTRVLSAPGATPTGQAASAKPVGSPARASQAAPVLPMAIKKILLQGGKANFTDLSVKPNFSAGIQSLEGSVLGLVLEAQFARQGGFARQRGRLLAGVDHRRSQYSEHGAVHRYGDGFSQYGAQHLQPLFRKICGIQHHQGQADHRASLQGGWTQARRDAPHPHRSARIRRQDGEQGCGVAARKARGRIAQGSKRRHRSRFSGERDAR